jgi:hypothetical protein
VAPIINNAVASGSTTNEIATIEAAAFGALSEAGAEAGNAVVAPYVVDYEASRS